MELKLARCRVKHLEERNSLFFLLLTNRYTFSNFLNTYLVTKVYQFRQKQNYFLPFESSAFKGGYLDCSHLTELENIYITEIYKRKKNTNHQ